MKAVLLFLAGVLVGANLVYFLVSRDRPAPLDGKPALPAAPAVIAPAPQTPSSTPADVPAPAGSIGTGTAGGVTIPAPTVATTPAPAAMPMPGAGLLLPVQGITAGQLSDTFGDTRSGERQHEALDIMAARGTPVLAAIDGKVEKLFNSKLGGLTIYEFDPDATHAYYYAHLDRYAPGLVEGMQLKRGDVLGYVGSTGNASPDAPHLHFAIFVLGPEKHWWQGTPINPYPLLTATR